LSSAQQNQRRDIALRHNTATTPNNQTAPALFPGECQGDGKKKCPYPRLAKGLKKWTACISCWLEVPHAASYFP
jgi:hypothetical protein